MYPLEVTPACTFTRLGNNPCVAYASELRNETVKWAYLASTFRGKALDWFTHSVETTPEPFTDYSLLEGTIQETFGESEDVRKGRAQVKITHLRHTSKVREYVAEFDSRADELTLPVSARQALFQGLKAELRDRLISVSPDDYSSLKREAARIAALTTVAHMGSGSSSSRKRKQKGKKTSHEKCGKCGRTNHNTEKCLTKTTANAIRVLGLNDEGNTVQWK